MKKILICIISIFLLCSCNSTTKLNDTNKVNNIEKNQGNLLNQGFVVSDDDYIYYTNLYEDNNIYKKTKADSKEIILTEDKGLYMNLVNTWLYYVRQKDGKIYKIKTDGTDQECIGGQNVLYLNVIGNDIYYSNKVGLYKLNEEKEVKEILKGSIKSINIVDDNIFYINLDDSKIHSMKIDGTNNKVINEKEAIGMQIVDGWCYFCTKITDKYDNTYKMRVDGSELTNMQLISAVNFNISDGYMYYYEAEGGLEQIVKTGLNKDLTKEEDLNQRQWFFGGLDLKAYNIIDKTVYTCGQKWENKTWQVDLEGKNKESITKEQFENEIELTKDTEEKDTTVKEFQSKFPKYKLTHNVEYKDEWWYFWEDGLNRISDDGQNIQKLANSNWSGFEINGEWIYYISNDGWKLSRIKLDGTDNEILSPEEGITNICKIEDNEIYFLKGGDCGLCSDFKLFVLNPEDLSQKQILDFRGIEIHLLKDKIIYNETYTQKGVHIEK